MICLPQIRKKQFLACIALCLCNSCTPGTQPEERVELRADRSVDAPLATISYDVTTIVSNAPGPVSEQEPLEALFRSGEEHCSVLLHISGSGQLAPANYSTLPPQLGANGTKLKINGTVVPHGVNFGAVEADGSVDFWFDAIDLSALNACSVDPDDLCHTVELSSGSELTIDAGDAVTISLATATSCTE